jgi:hypothetical protein
MAFERYQHDVVGEIAMGSTSDWPKLLQPGRRVLFVARPIKRAYGAIF